MSDTTLINDVSINGNEELTPSTLSETLQDNTINALGIDASSRTIWVNGQPYGNAYVNVNGDTLEAPIGAEIFNDFVNNVASGEYSHAEGYKTTASGNYSHASGLRSKALNASSYAEGYNNESSGNCAHSEGSNNYANADNAHVEGNDNLVEGHESHAEGIHNRVYGNASHAEGNGNRVLGDFSHVEGTASVAYSHGCHAEGYGCGAGDLNQKDILDPTLRTDSAAHAEGIRTIASGMGSHSEGLDTHASGIGSHVEGTASVAYSHGCHAEGVSTKSGVKGYYIKGIDFKNKKIYLTTEQVTSVKTSGFLSSDIENINIPYTLGVPLSIYNGKTYDGIIATSYKNNIIFVESLPFQNVVSITEEDIKPYDFTLYSLEEYKFGGVDLAYGSHSEGSGTRAFGYSSHASGIDSYASGIASHSSGFNTKSTNDYEFSVGKWNKSNDGTIFSIGIGEKGTSEDIDINRKNAFEVYSNGNININEGDVNINKNATINGSFDVNGTIKLLGTTYIGTSDSPKNLNIRGDLGINGNTRIGNSIHEDTLTINATTTANAAITAPEFIGKLTGNADSSTKLRDTRQFNVDLSSDNKTLFDGTNDCTMGVTGTLDVPNGGTGRTSFTKFGILYGNAEEQIKSSAAPIRENQVLLSKLTTNTTGEAVYTPVWRDQFYINEIKKIESNTGGIDITLDIEGKDSANQPYEDISVNIPLASKNTYAGLISNVNQSFAGTKTFDDINIDQKLEVSGNTILHNTVTVNDILTVNGDATFNGVANINNDILITGSATFEQDVVIENDLTVSGDTDFHGNVNIDYDCTYDPDSTEVYPITITGRGTTLSDNDDPFYNVLRIMQESTQPDDSIITYPALSIYQKTRKTFIEGNWYLDIQANYDLTLLGYRNLILGYNTGNGNIQIKSNNTIQAYHSPSISAREYIVTTANGEQIAAADKKILLANGKTISNGTNIIINDKTISVNVEPEFQSITVIEDVTAEAFYETSDATKKDIVSDIDIDFNKLRQIPKVNFNWKDDPKKKNNIGTIAQEIAKVYPEVVSGDEGNMTVDYAKLSIIALAAIDKLQERISIIESKIR